MALPDLDSSVGHSFGLEIDGVTIKQITEVTGLKMEQDVIELKQNTADGKYIDQEAARPAEGRRGHADPRPDRRPELREVGQGLPVRQDGRRPQGRRRSSSTTTRATPIKRYKLTNAWPKSLEIGIAEGRRHQRADREARRHLRAARGRVMRRVVGSRRLDRAARVRTVRRRRPPAGAAEHAADRVRVRAAARVRRRRRHGAPRRRDAAGDGPRRAGAAARRPGPGEPGVPDGRAARPGDHPARHASTTCTPASSRTCSPRTWRSCRTCTGGSTRRATPARAVTCPECEHEFDGRRRRWAPGGIVTYAPDRLYEEVAYVAYHFHWSPGRDPRPRARGPAAGTSPRSPGSTAAQAQGR